MATTPLKRLIALVALVLAASAAGAQTWTKLTNGPQSTSTGAEVHIHNVYDGNVYMTQDIYSSTPYVNHIWVEAESCGATAACWTDITTSAFSTLGTTGNPHSMGKLPNGTVLATFGGQLSGTNGVWIFAWNGSTASPVWTPATFTGVSGNQLASASSIYQMANDAEGYTYFSPAWSGDIWRNDSPNSMNFTKLITNFYSITNGGATGHATTGGIYELRVLTINGAENLCAGGEGELDCFVISALSQSTTSYLSAFTTAQNFTGNFIGLQSSASTIIGQRFNSVATSTYYTVNPTTLAITNIPSTSFPSSAESSAGANEVDGLHWITGTTWGATHSSSGTPFIILSSNDGASWSDISSGVCGTGETISTQVSYPSSSYYYALCVNAGVYSAWRYGPFSTSPGVAHTGSSLSGNGTYIH